MEQAQEQFHIGQIIKQQRERKHITQAKLCEGICDPSTLSRIENGSYHPGKGLAILLLQRLGIVTAQFYGLHRFDELEVEDLKLEIQNAVTRSNLELAITLRNNLEEKYGNLDALTQQFILWMKANNGYLKDGAVTSYTAKEEFTMLHKAICLTIPNFDIEKIHEYFLGVDELKIILDMANRYDQFGKRRFAIEIESQLIKYVKHHFLDVSDKSVVLPMITCHCSRMLGDEHRYEEELEISQAGIDCCIEYCSPRFLGQLLAIKSDALHHLGREKEARNCGIRAYYFLDTMNMTEHKNRVEQYMKEVFSYMPE